MTFPTIPTSAAGRVLSAIQSDTSGTRTFPSLTGLTKSAGDLLIAIAVAYNGNSTDADWSAWGAGFTEFLDSCTTATMSFGAAYLWSTGSETGTFTVTQSTPTGHCTLILMAIPGAHATTPPEWGGRADNTTAAANPTVLDPTSWATEDTLWIAVAGAGETALTGSFFGMSATTRNTAPWVPTVPTSFTGGYATGCSTDVVGGTESAVAFRQDAAASQDVDPWGPDLASARNAALVIAVRPVPVIISPDFGPMTPYRPPGAAVQRASAW